MKKIIITYLSILMLPMTLLAQKGDYRIVLSKVEYNSKEVGDSSNIVIDSLQSAITPKSTFKDKNISVDWNIGVSQFLFELTNNTDQTLKIIWDDAAYINSAGNTEKVFHTGVKYIDRNNSQPSSTVIKNAKISDLIAPTGNVYYSSGSNGGWREMPLFIKPKKKLPPIFHNKNVKILLPLLINGENAEYVFTFGITWVE